MIPSHATRVFSGVIFDVYQWEQEMYDGTFQTFEKLKRPDTVEVIMVTPEQKIMIVRQQQPDRADWFESLTGGRVEEAEEPLAAAKREMLEETGFASEQWELLDVAQLSSKIEWSIYVYVARDCKKIAEQTLDAGERIECVELTFDAFVEQCAQKKKHVADWVRTSCLRATYSPEERTLLKQKIIGG